MLKFSYSLNSDFLDTLCVRVSEAENTLQENGVAVDCEL